MIQSMTGYGKATAELSDKKINVEIKSLNSKAMDLSARIAPLYREKEMQIRNEISKMLERGKVDFSLWIEKKDAEQMATPINQDLVEAYYKRIKEISAAAGIPEPADWFATLLRMPDVMTKNETQELSAEEWEVVHVAVMEAINHLVDFRKQEGAALEKKFREKIANIAHLLETVAPYEQERVGKVKERITDALEKTLSVDYDKNRLEQEAKAVLFPEKEKKELRGGADGHVLAISEYEPGADFTYYWGAAWSKADIKDSAAWNAYMADFAQKVRNPLTVTVK